MACGNVSELHKTNRQNIGLITMLCKEITRLLKNRCIPNIIGIKKRNAFTIHVFQSAIPCRRNALIFLVDINDISRILFCETLTYLRGRVCAPIVYQYDLDIILETDGLPLKRPKSLFQILFFVVDGHYNAEGKVLLQTQI